ncbi:tripartite tricarboxylate transporter TctB family protein [Oceanobacillus jeddahense]|uniref:Tripartite tricarboxylate transporter TctB family protein n=1 Tax=Oceanobacillus jeddahense TaxID=1462527 RepID=A0ABY5JTX4_9BACI|nr:tripartite tricarboxylate transporter TctB family protein [Oceanobacillus jeddahense]UUI02922.1 tripartite tricarboxylate transporter TctB family protein [Oceanobacillus jeddahense]
MQTIKKVAPGFIMIIVSLIFLSQTFVMEKASLLDPAGGSFLPTLIIIVMIITGIIVIIQDLSKKKNEKSTMETKLDQTTDEEDGQNPTGTEDIQMTLKQYTLVFTYFLLIILYVLSISFLPFNVSTFLFLSISIFYLRGISWKKNILVSIGSVVIIYLVFTKLFHIIFP